MAGGQGLNPSIASGMDETSLAGQPLLQHYAPRGDSARADGGKPLLNGRDPAGPGSGIGQDTADLRREHHQPGDPADLVLKSCYPIFADNRGN